MINEIRDIPDKAEKVFKATKNLSLPIGVPYLGMGSSYYATLALFYQGIPIRPEPASEYYNYLKNVYNVKKAVLISQSGKTSEVLWCREVLTQYIAITNDTNSTLARSAKSKEIIDLRAGNEIHAATKTYVNTLITLYNGLGVNPAEAVKAIKRNMKKYEKWGENAAKILFREINSKDFKGVYIIGNGPNIATVRQGALVCSETTKYPFIGMSVSQYDHGPKETASGTAIILVKSNGPSNRRTENLFKLVEKAGAKIIQFEETELEEHLSPITAIIPISFMAHHLAVMMKIPETFAVGKKVTQVDK